MGKENLRHASTYAIVLAAVIFIMMVLLIYNGCVSQEVAAFVGNYAGGFCTLLAVWFGVKSSQNIQERSEREHMLERQREMAQEVSYRLAVFAADISAYFWNRYHASFRESANESQDARDNIDRSKSAIVYFMLQRTLSMDENVCARELLKAISETYQYVMVSMDTPEERWNAQKTFREKFDGLQQKAYDYYKTYQTDGQEGCK